MFRRALPWVGWAFAGLALVSLWGWYVYSQRALLDKQNQRELAHAARDLGTILSGLSTQADWFFKRTGYPSEIEKQGALREFATRNPYITSSAELALDPCREQNAGKTERKAGLVNPGSLALPSWFQVTSAAPNKPDSKISGLNVNTEAIFEDVVISDAFEYLFIAKRDGELLFDMEHGASAERRAELGELELRAQQDPEREHLTIRLRDLRALETLDGNKLDPEALALAGGFRSIRLGEEVYQLYSYPFEISEFRQDADGKCSVSGARWIVGGLVDPKRMSREAITISPQWTFLLFVFLLVALASQPFVKLFLLSPTERFRFSDACLLLPSATFLLLLATILILDAGTYWRLQALAAGGLEAFAYRVEANFTAEIRQMRDQLVAYDEKLKEIDDVKGRGPRKPPEPCKVPEPDDAEDLLVQPDDALLAPPRAYRDFAGIFWVDSSGEQFLKGTVHRSNSPRVNVAHRPYFTEARDGHLWSFSENPDKRERRFFVQSFRSFTTGDLNTAVSIQSELKCPQRPKQPDRPEQLVAVMSAHPASIEWPRLPLGYGFAIITTDGLVLYHSERRRVLKEQLYEEVSDPERLHAAVRAGTPQRFITTYSRRPTEMFLRPFVGIDNTRWFVVTFRNKQWLSTANTEVLLRALSWSLVPFAVSLVLCLVLLLSGKRCLELIAPDERKAGLYRVLVLACAAALLVGLAGTLFLPDDWLFRWALSFPVWMAVLTVVVYLAWSQKRGGTKAKPGFRSCIAWYMAALAGLWASAAIVPGAGLFRHSWRMEMDKFQLIEQKQDKQQRSDWTTRDEELARNIKIADLEKFLAARQGYFDDYQIALAEPHRGRMGDRWLERYLPLYNEVAEQLRYQGPAEDTWRVDSTATSYNDVGVVLGGRGLLGGAFTVLVAWWWLRYKVRHLFCSHLAGRQTSRNLPGLAAKHPFVIFLTPSQREKAMVAALFAPRLKSADARPADGESALTAGTDSFVAQDRLLVDDLECAVFEHRSRREMLKRLEQEVAKEGGRAVIVSPVDPFQLFNDAKTDGAAPADQAVPASEKERWLQVLEPFVVLVTSVGQTVSKDSSSQDRPSAFAEMRIHEGYFCSLWRYCSRKERLTLIQVAEEGFANPYQAGTLKRLVEKGLIVLQPNMRLVEPAFEAYVLQMASSHEVKTWEQPEKGLGWRGARWIFALVLVGALITLGGTQETWIRSATGMLTVIAGGLEAVWQLLRAVQRSQQGLAS